MMRTIGYCHGIENYSRHMSGRLPGEAPPTLLDYVPSDFLLVVDESHQTIPQVRAMYHGDRSRKQTLVNFGFRMPSALDNRPLTFEEFEHRTNQIVYVSATPGPYELTKAGGTVVEQVIRPTGLVDPQVEVRPVKGQVDDLLEQIRIRTERNERVLVTTLTKRMAEDLAEYFAEVGVRCRYLHSEIETLERVKILRDLRRGEFDVLIGINLLREGLDLPEVSLVAILDADKEGYLRSATSLIQSMGRCARHIEGRAILYADRMTDSMRQAIGETNRRRAKQEAYNREHNITPQSIIRSVDMQLARIVEADYLTVPAEDAVIGNISTEHELLQAITQLESQMREAAKNFEFERAAALRDRIRSLKQRDLGAIFSATVLNVDPAATQLNVEPAADSPAPPSAPNQSAPVSNLSAPASNPQSQQADAAATPPARQSNQNPQSRPPNAAPDEADEADEAEIDQHNPTHNSSAEEFPPPHCSLSPRSPSPPPPAARATPNSASGAATPSALPTSSASPAIANSASSPSATATPSTIGPTSPSNTRSTSSPSNSSTSPNTSPASPIQVISP